MKKLLVCFLLIAVPCGSVQAAWAKNAKSISAVSFLWREINKSRLGMVMLGVGALSATIYGTGKIYRWLVAKNDIQCMQEARSALSQVRSEYGEILSEFNIPSAPLLEYSAVGDPDEPRLQAFAGRFIVRNDATENAQCIDNYLSHLNAAIIRLETHRIHLNNRVGSVGRPVKQTHVEMRGLAEEILFMIGRLKNMQTFLSQRSEYFKLYEVEKVYSARYGDEIGFATIYKDQPPELTENTRRVVMVYNSFVQDAFPYCRYMRDAATAISTIRSRAVRQERQYPMCVQSLRTILDCLNRVQGVVAQIPSLERETRSAEKSRLREEAITAEQAKAAALEHQAQAKEKEVWAIQAQTAATQANTIEMALYRASLDAQSRQLELFRKKYETHDIVAFLRNVSQRLSGNLS